MGVFPDPNFEPVIAGLSPMIASLWGFRSEARGTHTSRTIMLDELSQLLAAAYRQASRNETITSLLAKCAVPAGIVGLDTRRETLMDRRGEGVAIILDRSERLPGKRPVYRLFNDAELRLTIYAAGAGADGSG